MTDPRSSDIPSFVKISASNCHSFRREFPPAATLRPYRFPALMQVICEDENRYTEDVLGRTITANLAPDDASKTEDTIAVQK
jgi:hypothetical protein